MLAKIRYDCYHTSLQVVGSTSCGARERSLFLDQRCLTSPFSAESIEELVHRSGGCDGIDQTRNALFDRLKLSRNKRTAFLG